MDTPRNWEEIQTLYEVHGWTPKQLSEKFNIQSKTIRNRASKYHWRDNAGQNGTLLREHSLSSLKQAQTETLDLYNKLIKNAKGSNFATLPFVPDEMELNPMLKAGFTKVLDFALKNPEDKNADQDDEDVSPDMTEAEYRQIIKASLE